MGYSLIKDKNVTIKGIKSYLVDSVDDIATLPTTDMPGSTALVAGTRDTYTLNNSYEWVEEEGSGDELPPVTSEDNGQILKVVEGAWNKGNAPSGLPDISIADQNRTLVVVNTTPPGAGSPTVEWQVAHYPSLNHYNMTTGADGTIDLSSQLMNKIVVGFMITMNSENRPDDYTYEVKYTRASQYMPYGPVITVKSGGSAYASKNINFDVRYVSGG